MAARNGPLSCKRSARRSHAAKARSAGSSPPSRARNGRRRTTDPMTAVALGERVSLPASLAWHGSYALVAEAVIAACRDRTRAVIDLGCGWGRSLFEIWLRGGPRLATYHALEFTAAGLDCVTALAALEPAMSIRTARFDFRHPDFSFLSPNLGHAVVFTRLEPSSGAAGGQSRLARNSRDRRNGGLSPLRADWLADRSRVRTRRRTATMRCATTTIEICGTP